MLVGTQMVAKGHHFTGVELAAVVDADAGLALPDFRAEERTFQLLTQLAGRSGRDAPGRVRRADLRSRTRARSRSRRATTSPGFLAGELERRELLGYPPFRHLVRMVVSGPEPEAPLRALAELRAGLEGPGVDAARPGADPAPARPPPRAARRRRPSGRARSRRGPRDLLAAAAPAMRRDGLAAVVDVDPQSM